MELAARMKATATVLELTWAPRGKNMEADALTNEDFRGFSPSKRMAPDFSDLKFLVLDQLMSAGADFEAERVARGRSDGRTCSAEEAEKALKGDAAVVRLRVGGGVFGGVGFSPLSC